MSRFRYGRVAVLAVSTAALLLPASASAHPSVYESTAKAVPSSPPSPLGYGDLLNETRYVVTNHGNSYVLKETNGQLSGGVLDYKRAPGAWRAQDSVSVADLVAQVATGVQAHNVCHTPALDNLDNITAWQEVSAAGKPEPFFDYVPFQKKSAGLGDDPHEWIELVNTLTGVDLSQVSDDPATAATQLKALCEGLGGTFVPADATVTLATAFNSATIQAATDPLMAQIADYRATAAADAQVKSAAAAENTALKARFKNALIIDPTGTLTVGQLTGNGVSAKVTGPAGKSAQVRIVVSQKRAKALRLKARTLAKTTVKIGADGTVLVNLVPSGSAKSALQKAQGSLALAFRVAAGDRSASTTRSVGS